MGLIPGGIQTEIQLYIPHVFICGAAAYVNFSIFCMYAAETNYANELSFKRKMLCIYLLSFTF